MYILPSAPPTPPSSSGARCPWSTAYRCSIATRRCSTNTPTNWPPSSPARTARPCLPPLPLRRPHLPLIQPEVVRHLVPDRILHQLGEVLRTARHPLVRTLENRDAVRHRVRFEHAPPGQRTPFIETQQRSAARHAPAHQLPRVRLLL